MILKRLEIFGFKSFADKVRIDFQPGVTTIVGPNGCGKTNIFEAIRWVLGEQSAKQLRGSRMEDVIFNGSKTRKPVGFSEVSLTLDNSRGILPIDYEEVNITRRLFRSGESQYQINKAPCRLKDILGLFMDTGIGTHAYSLMEQGKIEFILNSKPEDRRFIFEEAAGIVKYKSRKEEALRKLERTRFDLQRLQDIIGEIKKQINSLDYQARKARLYKKMQNELRDLEIKKISREYLSLGEMLSISQKDRDNLQDELTELTARIDGIEAKIKELQLMIQSKDEEIMKIKEGMIKISSQISLIEDRSNLGKERIEDIAGEMTENQNELIRSRDRLEQIIVDIEAKENRRMEMEKFIEDKKNNVDNLRQELDFVTKELKEKTMSVEEKKALIIDRLNNIANIRNRLADINRSRGDWERRRNRIEIEKESLLNEKKKTENALFDKRNRLEGVKENLNKLNDQVRMIESEREENKSRLERIEKEFVGLEKGQLLNKSRLKAVQENIDSNGIERSLSELKEHGIDGIHGPIRDLVKFPRDYENVLIRFLGERLSYVVCNDANSAQEAIEVLRSHRIGYLTFVPLSLPDRERKQLTVEKLMPLIERCEYDEKFRPVVELIFGNVYIVDQISDLYSVGAFREIVELSSSLKSDGGGVYLEDEKIGTEEIFCVTVDGHIYSSRGTISGGCTDIDEFAVGAAQDINILKDKITQISISLEKLDKERQMESSSLNQKDVMVRDKERESIIQRVELEQLTSNIKHDSDFLEELVSKIDFNIKQKEELEEGLELENKDKSALEEELASLEGTDSNMEQEIAENKGEIDSLNEKRENKETEFINAKIELVQKESELASNTGDIERLKDERKRIEDRIGLINGKIENLRKKSEEINGLAQVSEDDIKQFFEKQDTLKTQLDSLRANRDEINGSLKGKETELHDLKRRASENESKIHQCELDRSSISAQRQQIEKNIRDSFNISIEETSGKFEKDDLKEENEETKMGKLRKRIDSMGAVNLAAPEEYERLEERYKFLKHQEEDLTKASDDLHKVVNKINAISRKQFKDTFLSIQEHFRNVFRRLFEGGEADIILVDEGTLLESGIDVVAQPVGKKLQNISLLSGGERALCAIALLFAIFLHKPSPFCILDEVDAALDDANIQRFTNILKDFTERSQFIVVSHNKKTMEVSDVLYGITMEERGVSKLISVKFHQ